MSPVGGDRGGVMRRGLKQRRLNIVRALGVGFLTLATFAVEEARATEGYFQHGFGARQQALGGAGVADSRDAMALSLNPAGLVDVGHQFQAGASLFMPYRSYTATGTNFIAGGTAESDSNYFVVPNIAYNRPLDADSSIGFALFGNGGMNTDWANVTNGRPFCAAPGSGVYCGGASGVDLMQAFLTAGYARRLGVVSIGVAPVFAIQRFKADGLSAFAGSSSDAANLTNNGYNWSYGGGVRAGVQWNVAPNIRLGLSGQTRLWMTKLNKYRGLFAERGGFDIPANFTVGVAWDATPDVTLMFDYKRIFYSTVKSVANPMASPMPAGSLGLDNGSGFGWSDVDAFKFAVEWRYSPVWTFRLGYAHNNNPIGTDDVTFGILAPGVITDHFTGGFSYQVTKNSTIEFAAAYMPSHSVSGIELTGAGPTAGSNIELSMHQYQFTLGYTYNFDPAPARKSALVTK